MKDVLASWVLPTLRESGNPLPPAAIVGTEVALSGDGGLNYTVLDIVAAPAVSIMVTELEIGTWWFRFVVIDNAARKSDELAKSYLSPDETPPQMVTNVQFVAT